MSTSGMNPSLTFYFYDLETSGFNPRTDRIMQFGGQRVDMNLQAVGEPDDMLIALSDDILPSPDAILVTGITPQKTRSEGYTEAEFLKIFHEKIAVPGTIFVGYNTVRFDDEFVRFLQYRNFYDAYEWQWKDNRGRWDMLDVVRMTRALRPEGIVWPFDSSGKPSNRLELLTSVNKLDHANAHDALSDVNATLSLARLLKSKQPKLFDYLFDMRDKRKVAGLVDSNQQFVYVSGKFASEFEKATIAIKIADHPKKQGSLVYDLRHDPGAFTGLPPEKLADAWKYKKDRTDLQLPVKTLQYNRCPAIAPISVLDSASQKRLGIDMEAIEKNKGKLTANPEFVDNLIKALEILDEQQQTRLMENENDVDGRLYDSFLQDADRNLLEKVHNSNPGDLILEQFDFKDDRMRKLLPLYKARNFSKKLSDFERTEWEAFRDAKIAKQMPGYLKRLQELLAITKDQEKLYLLEELRLYAESISPALD